MTPETIDTLRQLMEYEASRSEPPTRFPTLPDVPAGRYISPQFQQLEHEHVWRKSWLLAAHRDELPEPGCWMQWDNAGQPVVLTHCENGNINAFYNTCSHRGAPVATEPSGKSKRLTCQYHGWSYGLDGELKGMRDPEDFRDLDKSCRGLTRVRCETFGKLIFVNFDPEAPTLQDWFGPLLDEWKEFQLDKCRLSARAIFDIDCNWKIAMEANTEVYHVRSIHPNTVSPILDDRRNVNTLYLNGHGRMVAPVPAGKTNLDSVDVTPSLTEIDTVGEIGRSCTQSYGLFPNIVVLMNQHVIPPIMFWPNGIDKCRIETWTIAPDWGDGDGPDMWTENRGKELCEVLKEDTQFGEKIQQSMQSYAFTGVPLSYQESRIYHWNQQADKMIGPENIPAELRVKPVIDEDWIYPNDPRLSELVN